MEAIGITTNDDLKATTNLQGTTKAKMAAKNQKLINLELQQHHKKLPKVETLS